jgi:hypothetical protein
MKPVGKLWLERRRWAVVVGNESEFTSTPGRQQFGQDRRVLSTPITRLGSGTQRNALSADGHGGGPQLWPGAVPANKECLMMPQRRQQFSSLQLYCECSRSPACCLSPSAGLPSQPSPKHEGCVQIMYRFSA